MALSVSNNNGAAPITADGVYCTIQVPGYIPPEIAGPGGSCPAFESASYYIAVGAESVTGQTIVTFQAMTSDGLWRDLANPAPINLKANSTYNSTLAGYWSALQLVFSGVSSADATITYAQLAGTPHGPSSANQPFPLQTFQSTDGSVATQVSIDPLSGDLVAQATSGPNAGKSVNLTSGKWV